MFVFDAHLDLSMNAMEWNRDLTLPLSEINAREKGLTDKPDRGNAVVCLPELRKGNIGLVVATQIARYIVPNDERPGWYSPQQAWAQTQGQLAWYKTMEAAGEMVQITNLSTLENHLALWCSETDRNPKPEIRNPIGYILSLEGTDSFITLDYVEKAYEYGLRAIGPAHYGTGRYANGTNATGKMGQKGLDLLTKMADLNIILDATHLCDDAFWQAMTHFDGAIWASHNLCRSIVDHNRQFSDDQIKELIGRNAVIGAAFDAWMVVPNWVRGTSTPLSMNCNIEKVIDHIDHICQLAGNAQHVGIGTDLDGAFGNEQCPYDLETIADVQKIPNLLKKRGYTEGDVEGIMHGNFLRFLRKTWAAIK
jgi:membrane dipeptidase